MLQGALATASFGAAYALLDPLGLLDARQKTPPAPVDLNAVETGAIERESVRVSHLLRRAGFGASPDEYERYQSMGLQAAIDELVNYDAIDDSVAEQAFTPSDRNGPIVAWLARMANTKRPLQEKLTLFWHGLLTTQLSSTADPDAMLRQIDLLRRNAAGDFGELLHGVTVDRSMMVYLDMDGSERRSPNENYARELMELFTMGTGAFTEDDVRAAARAFTGWKVPRDYDQTPLRLLDPVFDFASWDPGEKTFLGRTSAFDAHGIIDVILDQPATSRYVVRRLFEHFVYPEPDDATLQPFIDTYVANGRQIRPVVDALLRSDAFYSQRAYRGLPKAPVEYAVGAIKALGGAADAVRMLPGRASALRSMGQVLYEPPNVSGWRGGRAWFASSMLFARLNFINQATGGGGAQQGPPGASTPAPMDPSAFPNAAAVLDHFARIALDDNLRPDARQVILDHAGGAEAALTVESMRDLAYLVLAAPEFHLA